MGSGGGGSSGKVEYPAYLQTFHGKLLDNSGGDTLIYSITDLMNDGFTSNPFQDGTITCYSGRDVIDASGSDPLGHVSYFVDQVIDNNTTFDPYNYYRTKLPQVASDLDAVVLNNTVITNASSAFSAVLEPDVAAEKARHDADVATLGGAMSSAYTLGKSFIDSRKQEKVNLYDSDLRAKMYLQRNDMVNLTTRELLGKQMMMLQIYKEAYSFAVEAVKLKILNEREYTEQLIDLKHRTATWRFDVIQHGFNAIASIGGGTSIAGTPKLNSTQATVSGAFTGASIGAQVGGGYGAAAGAVIGGVAGYLSR